MAAAMEGDESVLPSAAVDAIQNTLAAVEDLAGKVQDFLSFAGEPEALADLPPLVKARAFLALAQSTTALFSVRLRCAGIQPDKHAVQTELERLSLYEDKLKKYMDWSNAPLRPSTRLNSQAAARFIGHSLPNLTQEQRQKMHELGRRDAPRWEMDRLTKKRKSQTSEKKSVRDAAKEFLEKATRELRGSNNDGLKGPLRINDPNGEGGLEIT